MSNINEREGEQDPTPIVKPRAAQAAERTVKDEVEADYLVDETGAHIGVPEDKVPARAHAGEETIGATGPNNWWRRGIILLAILIALLIILQLVTGGSLTPSA